MKEIYQIYIKQLFNFVNSDFFGVMIHFHLYNRPNDKILKGNEHFMNESISNFFEIKYKS